ncbi:IS66 family insertion sequence element accessory protein TnpA [Verrucomicrobiota bacterium sgz303538]
MTSPNESGSVLKSDYRGRVRVPEERREALSDEFEKSGLSGQKFAQLAGVNYATFMNWVQKRRDARKEQGGELRAAKAVQLLEAVPELSVPAMEAGLCIELPGGARMIVDAPGQLAMDAGLLELLSAKGRSRC